MRFLFCALLLIPANFCLIEAEILDFGKDFPEYIQKNSAERWIINFHSPQCPDCVILEPTFANATEMIENKYDNLFVGRVNCLLHDEICEMYGARPYPMIKFMHQGENFTYSGDLSIDSLVGFAERMMGPDIISLEDCKALKDARDQHKLIVVSTIKNRLDDVYQQFRCLAHSMKAQYWFYNFDGECENLIENENIFVLKRHLERSYPFDSKITDKAIAVNEPITERSLKDWFASNSYPVYSRLAHINLKAATRTGRVLVIAILDKLGPGGSFQESSRVLHERFETIALAGSTVTDKFIFFWTTDAHLMASIAFNSVVAPNVMIMNPDLSYRLLRYSKEQDEELGSIPPILEYEGIMNLIVAAEYGLIDYQGGNSFLWQVIRFCYLGFMDYVEMCGGNEYLAAIVFIIYVVFSGYQVHFLYHHYGLDGNTDRRPPLDRTKQD